MVSVFKPVSGKKKHVEARTSQGGRRPLRKRRIDVFSFIPAQEIHQFWMDRWGRYEEEAKDMQVKPTS